MIFAQTHFVAGDMDGDPGYFFCSNSVLSFPHSMHVDAMESGLDEGFNQSPAIGPQSLAIGRQINEIKHNTQAPTSDIQ